MNKYIRKKFEEVVAPAFSQPSLIRMRNGNYLNPKLEDHWQTFQEGWEECMTYFKIGEPEKWIKVSSNTVNDVSH